VVDLRGSVTGARPVLLEASGKVTLRTARAIAQTGVDAISVGALRHSPRAFDLSLAIDRSRDSAVLLSGRESTSGQ
jgi:nicotinate-nucleotide pyrophosphorylase (carboxylating)